MWKNPFPRKNFFVSFQDAFVILQTTRQTCFVLLCLRYSLTSPVLSHVIPSPKPTVHWKIYPVRRTVLLERWKIIVKTITNNRTHTAIPTWTASALIQHILLKIQASSKKAGKTGKASNVFGRHSVQISGGTANKSKFHTAYILTKTKQQQQCKTESSVCLYTPQFSKKQWANHKCALTNITYYVEFTLRSYM